MNEFAKSITSTFDIDVLDGLGSPVDATKAHNPKVNRRKKVITLTLILCSVVDGAQIAPVICHLANRTSD